MERQSVACNLRTLLEECGKYLKVDWGGRIVSFHSRGSYKGSEENENRLEDGGGKRTGFVLTCRFGTIY